MAARSDFYPAEFFVRGLGFPQLTLWSFSCTQTRGDDIWIAQESPGSAVEVGNDDDNTVIGHVLTVAEDDVRNIADA